MRIYDEASTPPPGESPLSRVSDALRSVDFVCAVLGAGESNANVFFELGVAAGLGRPIFVISSASLLPVSLQAFPVVRAKPDDLEAIAFHLRAFLPNVGRGPQSAEQGPSKVRTRPAPVGLGDLLRQTATPDLSESRLESLVLEAFKRARVEVISHPTYSEGGRRHEPDMVAWFPDAPADIGSPLLVEIRGMPHAAHAPVDQVRRYLQAAQIRSALVVTHSEKPIQADWSGFGGYVFVIDVADLLKSLQDGHLFTRLLAERNRLVHGGA